MYRIKWFFSLIILIITTNMIVFAVDISVTDSSPYVNVNGRCSLVEAIDNANDDAPTHPDCPAGSGADVITLNRHITLTGATTFGFDGPTGLPSITSDITIIGNGRRIQRDTSAGDFRILHVSAGGNLTLETVVIRNGSLSANFDNGGGIFNAGELTVVDSVIERNQVTSIFPNGGGIYNAATGQLNVISSAIQDNTVTNASSVFDNGGGIYNLGSLTLTNTTIQRNSADEEGGGIWTNSFMSLNSSNILNNSAGVAGGGVFLRNDGGATININNTLFSGNTASESGGAIASGLENVQIFGSTFTSNSAAGGTPTVGGAIYNIGTMEITASTFSNNSAADFGGAIANIGFGTEVTLIGSTVSNNSTSGTGGGLLNASGEFYVQDSLITGNSANRGGGLSLQSSNHPLGFYVERTTVMNNTATFMGGGYYGEGDQTSSTIVNSTFTGNTSPSVGGGGIGLNSGGQVDLLNTTIAENSSTEFINSVGGVNAFAGTMTIGNTIVANNTNTDCSATDESTSLDNNLTTGDGFGGTPPTGWCSFIDIQPNDQVETDPLLAPLANNGNLGSTYLLQAGSPAIDAIATDCPAELDGIDQRGVPRGSGTCDVGAIADDEVILPEVYFETPTTRIDDEGTVTTGQNVNLIIDNTNGTLSAPGSLPLTVYIIRRGSATDSLDYAGIPPTLRYTFNAGNWVATGDVETMSFPINVIDDLLAEPDETIEFDLVVIGPGVLIAGQSSHVVTIIDDDIVENNDDDDDDDDDDPIVTTVEEEPTEILQNPIIGIFDPEISKLGFVQSDGTVRWDITVLNTSDVDGVNVVVSDSLNAGFNVISATTTDGDISTGGNTVKVTIPSFAVGTQVNLTIVTDASDGTVSANTACVRADNQASEECATALPVSILPNTGQTPLWRKFLQTTLLFMITFAGLGFIRYRIRSHFLGLHRQD